MLWLFVQIMLGSAVALYFICTCAIVIVYGFNPKKWDDRYFALRLSVVGGLFFATVICAIKTLVPEA